jgi:hypothetical protein
VTTAIMSSLIQRVPPNYAAVFVDAGQADVFASVSSKTANGFMPTASFSRPRRPFTRLLPHRSPGAERSSATIAINNSLGGFVLHK